MRIECTWRVAAANAPRETRLVGLSWPHQRPIAEEGEHVFVVRLMRRGAIGGCILTLLGLFPFSVTRVSADLVPTPYHYIKMYSGLCMDVPGSSTGVVQLIQYQCTNNPNQKFRFVPTGNVNPGPEYYIQNQYSGHCLDIEASGSAPGTRIMQYPCTYGANQRFRMKPWRNGVRIMPSQTNMCIDTPSSFSGSGAGFTTGYCADATPYNSWSSLGPYCRLCATNYADAWANFRNTNWFAAVQNSGPNGNDCTNFVSQSLGAGGYKMWWTGLPIQQWYYNGWGGYSLAWNGASSNYSAMLYKGASRLGIYSPGATRNQRPAYTNLVHGDLFWYDWEMDGFVDHNAIMVGWGTTDWQDQHSTDHYHAVWHLDTYNDDWWRTNVWTVQVNPYNGIF
jgi:Putative amidase domain/Ricin-type beta-trefoil lectin domain